MKVIESKFDSERGLLVTRLQGRVYLADVLEWKKGLEAELERLPGKTAFKMIVDHYGYEFGELGAHKEMRTTIPLTLAHYGFKTALFDLFDPVEVPLEKTRGISCVALAHVHHDIYKMSEYDRKIGRANEHFFPDYLAAEAWINSCG